MKFNFRLSTLMKHRKMEQDIAQRAYAEAQQAVRDQLAHIKNLYIEIDEARLRSENFQLQGGSCASDLSIIEEFIQGQKIRIQRAREKVRELMLVEEEKHEVLVERVQGHKILEKLKEKQALEFKKMKNKKLNKEMDDLTIMRFKASR